MKRVWGSGGVLAALAVVAALVLSSSSLVAREAPPGPRLALGVWSKRGERQVVELQSVDASGGSRRTVVREGRVMPVPFHGGSWSPDGGSIAFAGFKRGLNEDSGRIYIAPASGAAPRPVPGTDSGRDPVFAPDGGSIAFTRTRERLPKFNPKHPLKGLGRSYFAVTAWVVDLTTGRSRRLTPWRNGLTFTPTSYSPDGRTLLLTRSLGGESEVVALDRGTGRITVLAEHARDAAYSPDGSRIALVSYRDRLVTDAGDGPVVVGELYLLGADGGSWQRLTRSPEKQEESPSWNPSGQRLAFIRSPVSDLPTLGFENVLLQVNADGSCEAELLDGKRRRGPLTFGPGLYGPAWQPGPGREAGPISC